MNKNVAAFVFLSLIGLAGMASASKVLPHRRMVYAQFGPARFSII